MRISQLFGKTQREVPADADTISHKYLVRAGMISQVAAGVYAYLPLGWRVLRKIETIVRDEMDKAGGQELSMPVLQPLELWQTTGRDQAFGESLFKVKDRKGRMLALGPTHEEVITTLVSRYVRSYRDLPLRLYQMQVKLRDEPRPRGGLIRVREFIMKDLYSFDTTEEGLDISYKKMVQAYKNIYARCGLPALIVEADSGAIGGKDSNEFMLVAESGEDELICCAGCGYAANMEKAEMVKGEVGGGEALPVEEVYTPGATTIKKLADYLKIPENKTLKVVIYMADGELVFVMIRGDLDVNEIKLKKALKATDLRVARDDELALANVVAGYASPIGKQGIKIVADDSITTGTNFVAGGNKPEVHIKNVNYPRDFKADIIADIAKACEGMGCPRCQGKLYTTHGIEVGHVFKLGTFLSQKLGASFTDEQGEEHPIIMGCYGIGFGRLLAAAIEQNHDEKGIIWPIQIAPYQVCLTALYREGTRVQEVADKLYADLQAQGIEVLYDDRNESPGVKFNDADLIGIPLRITISTRTLEKDSAEVKLRKEKQAEIVPLSGVMERVKKILES